MSIIVFWSIVAIFVELSNGNTYTVVVSFILLTSLIISGLVLTVPLFGSSVTVSSFLSIYFLLTYPVILFTEIWYHSPSSDNIFTSVPLASCFITFLLVLAPSLIFKSCVLTVPVAAHATVAIIVIIIIIIIVVAIFFIKSPFTHFRNNSIFVKYIMNLLKSQGILS